MSDVRSTTRRGRFIAALLRSVLGCGLLLPLHQTSHAQSADVAGTWVGALDVGAVSLRLVVHVVRGADGALTATVDSPDQGANGIPVDSVSFTEAALRLSLPVIGARYEGRMESGDRLVGRWFQGGQSLPLDLQRTDEVPVVRRPQDPQEPFPYEVVDVRFPGGAEGVALAGTLTVPAGKRPHPAAILISGSGPQDRDESLFNHRPFRVLADYLTRQGLAVLRYDDRGVGASTGDFGAATTEDFADDARAAAAFLRTRPEVDAGRIGYIGHSEGGLVAPLAALGSDEPTAFLVLLAAPGVTGEEILYAQDSLIARSSGADDEMIARSRSRKAAIFSVLKTVDDQEAAADRLRDVMHKFELTEDEREQLRASGTTTEALIEQQIGQLNTPWFRFFLTYDPIPAVRRLRMPVLAMAGERDLQVPPQQNLDAIASALQEENNRNFIALKLAGLNHLFQTAETGHPSEYARIEETFAPEALEAIGGWIFNAALGDR